jgi:hypothetical protein
MRVCPRFLREAHRQLAKTPEADAAIALGLAGEFDPGKACEQAREGDAAFHARDVHADAHVRALAEGDVAVGLAAGIEALGLRELLRVVVRRTDADRDQRALGQRSEFVMAAFVTVLICSNLIGPAKIVRMDAPLLGTINFGAAVLFFPIS